MIKKNPFFCFFIFIFLSNFKSVVAQEFKKIAVVVTSFNNAKWYQYNLKSILEQDYPNFRLIYIDDCSSDNTAQLVENYIKFFPKKIPYTIVKNKVWKSGLANCYTAYHMIEDDEILVNVDGDDWLLHKDVLRTINDAYASGHTWVTWGFTIINTEPLQYCGAKEIPLQIINSHSYREFHADPANFAIWAWWHPRTFYGWIAKRIKLEDLLFNSSFKPLAPAPDSASMYPIFEMAGHHYASILEPAYVWNSKNPNSMINDSSKAFLMNRVVAKFEKYPRLAAPLPSPATVYKNKKADVLIISTSFERTKRCIESLQMFVKGINSIYLVTVFDDIFQEIKDYFQYQENVICLQRPDVSKILDLLQEHTAIIADSCVCVQDFDLSLCIKELERTFAFAFYGAGSTQIQPHVQLAKDLIAWQFKDQNHLWSARYHSTMALYRTIDIKKILLNLASNKDIVSVFVRANAIQPKDRKIGLSFEHFKCVVID